MADPSKTEKATPKRIEKARGDGKVLNSPDVLSFCMLFAGIILIYLFTPMIVRAYRSVFLHIVDVDCRVEWSTEQIIYGFNLYSKELVRAAVPMMVGAMLVAVVVMRIQVGKYFSTKAIKWKFDSFNPKQGIQSLLPKKDNFIKLFITMGKVAVISAVVYFSIKQDFNDIMTLTTKPIETSIVWTTKRSFVLVLKILVPIFFLAIIDFIHKRKQYYDNLKMSKQEIKDEAKNAQGDPKIKAQIRRRMMEILRTGMVSDVANADVVVTNPTHVAVAIIYIPGEYAPRVIAKGLRKQADNIKDIAQGIGIPIVEVPALARSLYRNIEVGEYITEEYFAPVAAVLAKLNNAGDKISAIRNKK